MSAALEILGVTLAVAGGATLLLAPFALAAGWFLARREFFGKSLVETIVALPLVLPPTAIGFLLLALFARDGALGRETLGFDPGIVLTRRGAILAAATMAFPLAARSARAAFESVPRRLEEIAHTLGRSAWNTFWTITVPLAARGLAAALVLAFGRALGEFGATIVVAGNLPGETRTLSLAIWTEMQAHEEERALALVGLATLVAFAVVWSAEGLARRSAPSR